MPFSFYIDEDALEEAEPPNTQASKLLAQNANAGDATGSNAAADAGAAADDIASSNNADQAVKAVEVGEANADASTEPEPEVAPAAPYVGRRSGGTLPALGAAQASADVPAADPAPEDEP